MPVAKGGCMHNNSQTVEGSFTPLMRWHLNLDGLFVKLVAAVGHPLVEHVSLRILDLEVNAWLGNES